MSHSRFQHRRAVRHVGAAGKVLHPAGRADMRLQALDLQPVGIEDRAVALDHRHDLGAILLRDELRGMIPDVAEPLDDHPLAVQRAGEPGHRRVLGIAEELLQRVLHAPPGRFDAPRDAAGIQRLAGDAGRGVDVGGVHPLVLVDDPGHLALAGAHVGGRHVLARVDQIPLAELIGEAAGDQLHLVLVPLARIDPEPALRAAERHLDQAALVGHQRRQRLDLVLVHGHREADAALDRLHMLRMHAAIPGEGVDRPAQPHPEAHGVGRVADPDLLLQSRREVHQPNGPIEHQIDGLAKARLAKQRVHLFPPAFSLAPSEAQRRKAPTAGCDNPLCTKHMQTSSQFHVGSGVGSGPDTPGACRRAAGARRLLREQPAQTRAAPVPTVFGRPKTAPAAAAKRPTSAPNAAHHEALAVASAAAFAASSAAAAASFTCLATAS